MASEFAFKIEHYLDRIGLSDAPAGSAGLARVQDAHMRAIPFENIDPLLGKVPSLAIGDVVAKLVAGRRGGYCFEHNALFGQALETLGYAPRAVLARVFDPRGRSGARSHQAFVVETDDTPWLCDTGFGGHGALAPLRLDLTAPQQVANGSYRLRIEPGSGETRLDRLTGNAWVPLYGFERSPVRAVDVEAANFLCARWEGAPFSANLMVAFHAEAGRIALFNRGLSLGQPPQTRQRQVASAAELGGILRERCGLSVGNDQIAAVWRKIERAPTGR